MNTIDPGELKHAKFSASGSEKWINCPGSMVVYGDLPDPPEGPWAAEGTRAHAALEILLKNQANFGKALAWVKKRYPEDMANHVYNSARRIIESTKGANIFHCETRVDSSLFTAPKQFGTVDAAGIWLFDKLKVFDFKYGAGVVVDVKDNPQLIYYALGIFLKYRGHFETIDIIVDQPRAYHESGKTFRSETYTAKELLEWKGTFRQGVERVERGDKTLSSGSWCKFCKAKKVCPAYGRGNERSSYTYRGPKVDSRKLLSKLPDE